MTIYDLLKFRVLYKSIIQNRCCKQNRMITDSFFLGLIGLNRMTYDAE